MKRVAIINFTGFRNNWGCQATSFELLKFVGNLFPPAEPVVLTAIPLLPTSSVDRHYDGEMARVYAAFSDVATATDRAASSLKYLEEAALRRYGFWADHVRNADLVVFQAEGSMGLGSSFAHGPRLMLLPFVAKHAWQRTVISLNQTFYSQDERVVKNAAEAFSAFDFTAFREPASVALARASGVANAHLVPDLAFMTEASGTMDLPDVASGEGSFAVSGSALKDPDRYRHIVAQTRAIQRETGLRPLLAVSRDFKLKIRAFLALRGAGLQSVPATATYTNVARMLAGSHFLLGGRYHMTIMAAAVGTPSLILRGNSIKNEGLAALIGSDRPVRNFDEIDAVVTDARALLADEPAIRAALQTRVSAIRATIEDARLHISSLIAGDKPAPFVSRLPEAVFDDGLVARYRKFGSGKKPGARPTLPGRRLGREASPEALLAPLLEGLNGSSEATLATLKRLSLGNPEMAGYLREKSGSYPALSAILRN